MAIRLAMLSPFQNNFWVNNKQKETLYLNKEKRKNASERIKR